MKRGVFAALALAVSALASASCSEQPAQEASAPEAPAGISASNARLMLPAVKGNPGAVYFDLANTGEKNMMIRAASVAGAGNAMLHVTTDAGMQETLQVAVGPGETVKFEPGGTHVMAMDLADTVTPGSKAEVTVTFVGGDKISFPAEVRAAGDER